MGHVRVILQSIAVSAARAAASVFSAVAAAVAFRRHTLRVSALVCRAGFASTVVAVSLKCAGKPF